MSKTMRSEDAKDPIITTDWDRWAMHRRSLPFRSYYCWTT
jgi:hypothetical protein